MIEIVEGPALAALTCGKPAFLVVLLHGPGESGQAMIDHALNWAPTLPKAEFLALEAPFGTGDARRWFAPGAGIETIAPAVDLYLDRSLAKRRLPSSHLALVGFSQGAALALRAALGRAEQIAAVVAFSPDFSEAPLPIEIIAKPPTLLVHGELDQIAPLGRMLETKAALAASGAQATALVRPGLGHAVDDEGVIAAADFLTTHVVHRQAQLRGD